MRRKARQPWLAVAAVATPLAFGSILAGCTPLLPSSPQAAAPAPIVATPPPLSPQATIDQPTAQPSDTLLETGSKVPCLEAFENLLVAEGFATWEELNAMPRIMIENEIVAEAASAGITIDELCAAVSHGFTNGTVADVMEA